MEGERRRILILSQVFVPDPASVGQHVADVAFELAARGYDVRVYTSDRGYDDPSIRYPARETIRGVDVVRLSATSFGKASFSRRILATLGFMAQSFGRALLDREVAGVFLSTSPPLVGGVGVALSVLRGLPFCYWAMDLNPDQLIASGAITSTSTPAKVLGAVSKTILSGASLVIALDRFMAERLEARSPVAEKLMVMPPWPHEHVAASVPHASNPFRREHGLDGNFVVMYSGNHSPSNPLTTVLQAAVRLRDDPTVRFLFVGGGSGKREVEQFQKEHDLHNVLNLPYQPLGALKYSLSAADLHVVTMGDDMVGIIHPCKAYGAMALARPILYVGPKPSHLSDLLEMDSFGHHVAHGDAGGCVAAIKAVQGLTSDEWSAMGLRGQKLVAGRLSQDVLCAKLCDAVERAFNEKRGARWVASSSPA